MAKMRKTKTSTKKVKKPEPEVEVEIDVEDEEVEDEEEVKPKPMAVRKVAEPEVVPRAEISLKQAAKLIYMGETFLRGRKYIISGKQRIEMFRKHGRFFVVDL